MSIWKKTASFGMAVGIVVGGLAIATPASATVINVPCPTNGVTIYRDYGESPFCYAGDPHGGLGWTNFRDAIGVSSKWNTGYTTITGNYGDHSSTGWNVAFRADGRYYSYGGNDFFNQWIWIDG